MMKRKQILTEDSHTKVTTSIVLEAVDTVLEMCSRAQQEHADPALTYVSDELSRIKDAIAQDWPLSVKVKRQIDLGPFAAKNIEDWNEALAEALMHLDYSLQHDGKMLDRIMPRHAAESASSGLFHLAS